ncbi:MAG: ferritin family protein [Deltaproteobacteria bacterium]|nr:ferritin family protein [Deltaproteobacteria bacterium]
MLYAFNAAEVFQIAIDIEENGRSFYEKAREKIDNEEVKAVFKSLGLAEIQHKELFASLLSKLPASARESAVWDPEDEMNQYLKMMADMHVFRTSEDLDSRLAGISSAKDALTLALEFEKDSIVFFLSMKDMTEEKQGRDLIDQLVKEELNHHKQISLELVKLKK